MEHFRINRSVEANRWRCDTALTDSLTLSLHTLPTEFTRLQLIRSLNTELNDRISLGINHAHYPTNTTEMCFG